MADYHESRLTATPRITEGDLEQRDARLQHSERVLEVAMEALATAQAN
jgi:hypothetical protein